MTTTPTPPTPLPSPPSRTPVRRTARDLRPGAFPVASPAEWADADEVLTSLYRRAEKQALDAVEWYLRDKRLKKRLSQFLRAVSIVLGTAGGLYPLVRYPAGDVQWGYVLLGTAAACVAFDRLFGLSSAWIRDIIGAQALQRRLEEFQYEWALVCGGQVASIEERLALLKAFSGDVSELVASETSEWQSEFQSRVSRLEDQVGASRPTVALTGDHGS